MDSQALKLTLKAFRSLAHNLSLTTIKVLQNNENTNKNKGYKAFRNTTFNASYNEVL